MPSKIGDSGCFLGGANEMGVCLTVCPTTRGSTDSGRLS